MIKGYDGTIIYKLKLECKKNDELKIWYQYCVLVDTEYGSRLTVLNSFDEINTDTIIVGYINGKYEIIKL